jgi:hypothetical protein
VSHIGIDREQLLASAFVELADTLVDDYDVIDLLDRLVAHGVRLLAADAAGILLIDGRRRLRVVASSNEEPDRAELLRVQTDEGPCVDCMRTGEPVTGTDLDTAAARWPRFAAALPEEVSGRLWHRRGGQLGVSRSSDGLEPVILTRRAFVILQLFSSLACLRWSLTRSTTPARSA